MTPSEFLSRFDKVKHSGGQALVCCPAHADKTPSLAVRDVNGQILLKCHGGCSTDSILQAMNLTAADLFADSTPSQKREIESEYNYTDETGKLLYQCIRYRPKGFSQRAPDGAGGWKYSLQGVRRVVYRLPQLKGHKAILFVEGEKDAERAWSLGLPATCNPMGAGKWDPSYAHQIKAAGVLRVAVIPDNDDVGKAHAKTVAQGLLSAGLEVRLVELPGVSDHGDLSEYAETHTKEDLLALVKQAPALERSAAVLAPSVPKPPRTFHELGEQRYSLEIEPEGILMEVTRLRRSSHELIGELVVKCNGYFPNARTFQNGVLNAGDLNFSSVQARNTRAKLLGERAQNRDFDWYGHLEDFVTTVIAHERRGKPAVALASVPEEPEDKIESWDVGGWPVLCDLPTVLFGDSASGKSYFAMWVAGQLATRYDIPVLYADWEFSQAEHRKRLRRLFHPMPSNVYYVRCEQSIRHETDHLIDICQQHKCRYIVCDSIGFAVEGPAEAQEGASAYFRYLRQLKVGSLNVAHIPKQYDDGKEAQIFGSVFFRNGARSVWFIERAHENPPGELRFGLYHRKNNIGEKLAPRGYKLRFDGNRTYVEPVDVQNVDELAAALPLLERIKRALKGVELTRKQLAEDLNIPIGSVKSILSRHKSQFVFTGSKIGLLNSDGLDF